MSCPQGSSTGRSYTVSHTGQCKWVGTEWYVTYSQPKNEAGAIDSTLLLNFSASLSFGRPLVVVLFLF